MARTADSSTLPRVPEFLFFLVPLPVVNFPVAVHYNQQHCTAIISAVCTCSGVDKAKPVSYSYANSFVIGISERCWLDHSNQAPIHKGAALYVIKLCSSLAIKYDNVVDEDVNEQQSFFKREAKSQLTVTYGIYLPSQAYRSNSREAPTSWGTNHDERVRPSNPATLQLRQEPPRVFCEIKCKKATQCEQKKEYFALAKYPEPVKPDYGLPQSGGCSIGRDESMVHNHSSTKLALNCSAMLFASISN
ncbi:hypothetical protein KQX54_008042 [Cotesia glomerata]|uniref:Uncharacterized protein n=1 Tax=Cotesia glomerata TaxID=32391 RepID=A0AAV7J753_COTGL|nr:hypothetical protein KQX54_008042 [Cotesia glomerata]